MALIKLIRGASYDGNGVHATKAKPIIEVSEEVARRAVASGFFETVKEAGAKKKAEAKTLAQAEAEEPAVKARVVENAVTWVDGYDVSDMNLAQLKAIAKQMGISGKGLKTKASYVEAIEKKAQNSGNSPTMMELLEE